MSHADLTEDLSRAQVEMFAAGLYHLAACDGIEESEVSVIREFVSEAGAPDLADCLGSLHFDPATAFRVFESTWLRKLFLQAAMMIIQADGRITETERETLSWMAMAFGIPGGYDAIAAQVAGQAL